MIQILEQTEVRKETKQEANLRRYKKWKEAHPERRKEIANGWYQRNKEEQCAKKRDWRELNPEESKANARAYYHKNAEKLREYERDQREKNSAEVKAYRDKYRAENRSVVREHRRAGRARFVARILEFKKSVGCIDCGYDKDPTALDFDHVRGEKVKNISKFTSFEGAYEEILKCDVRCANCHRIKTFKNREHRGWRNKLVK